MLCLWKSQSITSRALSLRSDPQRPISWRARLSSGLLSLNIRTRRDEPHRFFPLQFQNIGLFLFARASPLPGLVAPLHAAPSLTCGINGWHVDVKLPVVDVIEPEIRNYLPPWIRICQIRTQSHGPFVLEQITDVVNNILVHVHTNSSCIQAVQTVPRILTDVDRIPTLTI